MQNLKKSLLFNDASERKQKKKKKQLSLKPSLKISAEFLLRELRWPCYLSLCYTSQFSKKLLRMKGVGVGVKADYLKKDLGLYVGCPAWGSF